MEYLENELNSLETYSYNLKLYMIHPTNTKLREKNIERGNARLIASNIDDSRYNITAMEQSMVMGNNKVRATFGNSFTFEITEPSGATFLSHIASAAKSLNIKRHTEAYYIIVLQFSGRDFSGTPVKFKPEFYYVVKIHSFTFSTTAAGSTYSVTAVEDTAQGYSYLEGTLKGQITVSASTIGEFITEFNAKLNQDLNNRVALSDSQLFPDVYNFQFAKNTQSWLDWKFQALNDPINQSGYNIIGTGGNKKLQITVSAGSAFADVFGMLLALTSEYKQVVADTGGYFKPTASGIAEKKMDSFPVFFKIFAEALPKKFDPIRGAYQKEITFTLQKYIISTAIVDTVSYKSSITDTKTQSARVNRLNEIGLLKKKYNYLFTGQNTEILDLNLKFDFAYYSATSSGSGWYGDANVQITKEGKEASNMMARLLNAKESFKTASAGLKDSKAAEAAAKETQNAARAKDSIYTSIQSIADNVLNAKSATSFFENSMSKARIELDSAITDYTENFDTNNIAHQLNFESDVQSPSDAAGPESDLAGGTFQFGIIKSNIENSADMAVIELYIRGDPYWLGQPFTYDAVNTGGAGATADYTKGGNLFYLRTYMANADPDSNGRTHPSADYQMSGLYHVTQVINNYRDGLFTQYLNGVLDAGTNILTVAEVLDSNSPSSRMNTISGIAGANTVATMSNLARQETASNYLKDYNKKY